MSTLDYSQFDGVIAVGGDGTLHEIANAILNRSDQDSDLMVIGSIPLGVKGNGVAKSLLEQ